MIATPITIDVPLRTDDHGIIRVGGTKVRLEQIVYAFHDGESAEGIVDSYDVLKLADVYAVLAYYLSHRVEVDEYVRQVDETADRIQREAEANYPPDTLALLARLRGENQQPRP